MSQVLHYGKDSRRLAKLHDELLAAGIVPERVEGAGADVWLTVADGQDPATVASVVTAHDPTTPSASEQREATDRQRLQDLLAQADTAVDTWETLTTLQQKAVVRRLFLGVKALARGRG